MWSDYEQMLQHYRDIAEQHNVVLTVYRSTRAGPGRRGMVLLTCEQYGDYRPRKTLPPDQEIWTQSKKRGCRFALLGRELVLEGGLWAMVVHHGRHNHATPVRDLAGHAYAGRLEVAQEGLAQIMTASGSPPKAVWQTLRALAEDVPRRFVTESGTLKNLKAKTKRELMGGRTVTQQTLYNLRRRKYLFLPRRVSETDQTVSDLFLAHPDSAHLLSLFPYAVILDATYKTNR